MLNNKLNLLDDGWSDSSFSFSCARKIHLGSTVVVQPQLETGHHPTDHPSRRFPCPYHISGVAQSDRSS